MPLDQVVFNTEAHAFPHFELGKLFKTGWQRKPRDSDGKIIPAAKATEKKEEVKKQAELKIQTVQVAANSAKETTSAAAAAAPIIDAITGEVKDKGLV